MLAHYAQGSAVSPTELLKTARAIGLGPAELRTRHVRPALPDDRPRRARSTRARCPARELEVLKRLAEGKVYKQIALELTLSTSTVRTHLHNIYGKLGAVDRAQAVLHRHRARLALGRPASAVTSCDRPPREPEAAGRVSGVPSGRRPRSA